ncbi:MAG: hypothetical protein KAY96_05235 [Bacteroidia bacterium]|nr:hypothetical protein [Bacteroidia bacterium]
MDRLQEIIRVVGRMRLRRIEVFNETAGRYRKNLYYRLYQGIKEGTFKTDADASMALFGVEPSEKKYLMLKSRVKNRLLNTLLFLDNTMSRYDQAILQCNRNLVAAKALLQSGARKAGESMLITTLHQAEKFELNDVALSCLLSLRYSAAFSGNRTDFEHYRKRFREVEAIFHAECKAEEFYQIITLPFGKSSSNQPELASTANAFVEEIELERRKHTSFKLELVLFRLRVMAGQIGGNPDLVLEACDQTEVFLSKRKHLAAKIRYGEIALYRMTAYIQLGTFEPGLKTFNNGLQFFGDGSLNWMIFQEHFFLLCMHTAHYAKAAEVFRQATEHPRFSSLDDVRKEKWRIFEAFLRYILNGRIDAEAGGVAESQFKLMKFLNEVPTYSKDKRGLNIAIIILQILFLLDRRDFDGIIARAEALKVYCSRYLKLDENYRSNCFLKMMLLMEKKGFEYEATSKIADQYFQSLKSSRFNYEAGNLASLEIIPYEQLWSTILQKLREMT